MYEQNILVALAGIMNLKVANIMISSLNTSAKIDDQNDKSLLKFNDQQNSFFESTKDIEQFYKKYIFMTINQKAIKKQKEVKGS